VWGHLAGNSRTRPAVFVYVRALARGKETEKRVVCFTGRTNLSYSQTKCSAGVNCLLKTVIGQKRSTCTEISLFGNRSAKQQLCYTVANIIAHRSAGLGLYSAVHSNQFADLSSFG
jgi:hypothetical protein